jgi:hypothetical protein
MKFSKSDAYIVFELGRWNHNPSMRTLMHKKGHLHSGLGISLVHHQHQVYKKELAGSHWKHCFSSSASSSSDSLSSLVDSFQQNHSVWLLFNKLSKSLLRCTGRIYVTATSFLPLRCTETICRLILFIEELKSEIGC